MIKFVQSSYLYKPCSGSLHLLVHPYTHTHTQFPDVIQPILNSIEGVVNSAMQVFSSIHTTGSQDTPTDLYGSLQVCQSVYIDFELG